MSAWLVSKQHIDQLVYGAIRLGLVSPTEATKVGRMLWRANKKSIRARYGASRYDTPETYDQPTYWYAEPGKPVEDASLFKQVNCYDYQTCEYDAYERSPAKALIRRMERALEAKGITRFSPGYDEAPWGV